METNDWIGIWRNQMRPEEAVRELREYQKVNLISIKISITSFYFRCFHSNKINHFPNSFSIGRKDSLWKRLSHAQSVYGKNGYNFVPLTFILPNDCLLLKNEIKTRSNSKWILKPVC